MREVKVFKVILGIDKWGDIHSGWLDRQLSLTHFTTMLQWIPTFFQNKKQMDYKFLFQAL